MHDMSAGIRQRQSASSQWALAWIVASVLLVLHWSAPGVLQVHAPAGWHDASPGISIGSRAGQPGVLPQTVSIESNLPKKPSQRGWKRDDGSDTLLARAFIIEPPRRTPSESTLGEALVPRKSTRAFDARAPPKLTG